MLLKGKVFQMHFENLQNASEIFEGKEAKENVWIWRLNDWKI